MTIAWGEGPHTNSTHGVVAFLVREDWSSSSQATELKEAAGRLIDHPDDAVRSLAYPPCLY